MARLGQTSGASLVPDLSQSLNLALQTFGTPEIRAERQRVLDEAATEERRQFETRAQLEISADPDASRSAKQEALVRLAGLDVNIANAVRATLESGDEQATQVLLDEAEKGARNAAFINQQTDFASKQRAISSLANDAAARGEPLDDFIKLQNMNEDQLGLELQKREIGARDVKDILKPPAPQTAIAKARADLKAGLITDADFKTITSTPKEFQTDVGKLLEDQALAIEMFGPDSEQAKAISDAIDSKQKGEPPKLSDIKGIRGEFTTLSGDFIKLRDAIAKVEQSNLNPSPAGDLALIFNFMKIQDPGSVVRESEFATAQNATNLVGQLGAAAQRVVNGERMLPAQRQDFVDTANRLFEAQKGKQIALENSFRGIAERVNINPEDVIIDFIGDARVTEPDVITDETTQPVELMSNEDLLKELGL